MGQCHMMAAAARILSGLASQAVEVLAQSESVNTAKFDWEVSEAAEKFRRVV